MDWRDMDPAALDAAYSNARAVPAAPDIIAGWAAASARLREARPTGLDRPYGPSERERWDLFPAADPAAPCLVFIHGGYWQRNSREGFACMAEGALAAGWAAALPGYTLAPDAGLSRIVEELRRALDWLAASGRALGIGGPVLLSGWSAGGHLAALLSGHPSVRAALAISGIFDLEPIRGTTLNDKLALTADEIAGLSPQRLPPTGTPLAVAYGGRELPELRRQSREFHALRAEAGAPGPLLTVPDADHFSILEELRGRDGSLLKAAASLLES
ncbi:MAG: Putative esterase [uncultured Acetobacteraceae bacterium]|uniref:Esterase n=1 Tax=uncultured Acetobacteraceae bacterium TaxID=169975 RepID=A0A6J4IHE4_9PROT|nr:MAG: Putative esterase [uncultured Acetobacteraceae bacterium]